MGGDASAVATSLGAIVQWLRRSPLPLDEAVRESLHGLKPKPRHVAALMQLADSDRMSVSELAERLQISLATASQLVSDLAELGLVERVEDPADRRRTLVAVSEPHRQVVEGILNCRLRPIDAALQRLSADERTGLIHGLARFAAELEFRSTEVTS
jgi:DNA-binding MarR family transcriptional regulator